MKKILLPLFLLATQISYSQQISFNKELDQYCKNAITETASIPDARKTILDETAIQLAKKKYILFTCQTNSRRTVLLQAWAQTSFYYYELWDKSSFSIGDTVTDVPQVIAEVLTESGFVCMKLENADAKGYIISVSQGYEYILVSKKELGTIDTAKVAIVNICFMGEKSNLSTTMNPIYLPYQSPKEFENTLVEKEKYTALNKQIATEMFYLANKTKQLIIEKKESSKSR